ncbi:MAG: MarR family transcriptional regulator [Terracidiphilus sp.]
MPEFKLGKHGPVSFLLAQVGAIAARQFANALEPLKFSPSDAGILRLLGRSPGMSQQELAKKLDMHASRLVGVIDALEQRGLVAREPNPEDRRLYALHLTGGAGTEALAAIGVVARNHNEAICAGLNEMEREQLTAILEKIAVAQHLTAGVHPGYRDMGERRREAGTGTEQPAK